MELKLAEGEAREPEMRGQETAGVVAELKEEEGGRDEEEEDEEDRRKKTRDEGWCRRE